jgi:SNF2 family DNA or RNA helicase
MLKQYSQLTKDQLEGVNFLENRMAAGLWADVGTGKTVLFLTVFQRLRASFQANRALVVGPRLVAERVWHTEVEEWAHLRGLRVSRIIGTAAQRLKAMAADADIYTISRDNVCWLEEQFIRFEGLIRAQYRKWPWDTVILDESQSFKSQSSQRFKSMRRLRRLFSRIYLGTGSLMPNGYRDLWSQLYLLDGGARLGTSEGAYLAKFFTKDVNDGIPAYTIKPEAPAQIDALIADVFHIMRDSQPPAPENIIKVALSKEEKARYSKMVRTSVLQMGSAEITAVNAGVLWGKLLQLANGAVYDSEHTAHVVHNRKLDALWELLESLPKPVIIGYGFIHDVERIFAGFPRDLGRLAVLRTGKSLDAWRRGEIDYGIMHPASAGHGLNDLYVSGAENLVWFGLTANREYQEQLIGRIAGGHRRTGRKVCIHYILTEGTIDEEAMALLTFKGEQQSAAQLRIAQRLAKEHL